MGYKKLPVPFPPRAPPRVLSPRPPRVPGTLKGMEKKRKMMKNWSNFTV